jgi:hypothetical protein
MWHPSVVMRIILGILGVLALLIGLAAWSFENEYGGEGAGAEMEMLADGTVGVYDVDEQSTDGEGHPGRVLVFEGTQEEVDAWVAEQQSQGRNYLIPGLIIAVGVVLVVGAVFPPFGPRRTALVG